MATKLDKVRPTKSPGRRKELAAACRLDPGDVVWVSAAKGTGIPELRSLVLAHLDVRRS